MSTWKVARYHQSSGKCKSKPQWDTTSHSFWWLFKKKEINKKQKITKGWQGWGEIGTLYTGGGNVNWCSHFGTIWWFLKKVRVTIWPSNSTPRYIRRESKTYIHAKTCAQMFTAPLFIIVHQMSINWLMDKQNVVYANNRILFVRKRMKYWHVLQYGWTLKTLC